MTMIQFKGIPSSNDSCGPTNSKEALLPAYLSAPLRRWKLTLSCFLLSAIVAAGVALFIKARSVLAFVVTLRKRLLSR